MKKALAIIAGVIVLIVAVLVIAPFLIPTETYTAQVRKQVKAATGRDLEIAGDVGFSILPSTQLTVNKVAFANAEWADSPYMARLAKLRVQVDPWALLSGNLKVQRFVMAEPVIRLAVNEAGKPNWQFGSAKTAPAGDGQAAQPDGGGMGAPLSDVTLEDVRLVNGDVTYTDAVSGARYAFSAVNLSVALESLDKPFSAEGSVTYNGEAVELDLETGPPRALMTGASTDVNVKVDSNPLTLSYDGSVANAQPRTLDGNVDLAIPSVKRLAAWVGEPVEAAPGTLETFEIAGTVSAKGPRYSFTAERIAFDKIRGEGELTADLGGARPALSGNLKLGKLDVTPYMPPATQDSGEPAEGGSDGRAADGGAAKGPAEWSDEPIDVSALKMLDVDFDVSAQAIKAREIEVGQSELGITLQDGKLNADLRKLNLYAGSGTGRVMVDSRATAPKIAMAFDLTGVNARPLLADAAGFERLEGTGSIRFDVAGQGQSQKALVAGLDGDGAISFTDGAIVGINLAQMVRNVGNAFTGGGGEQKTDFAELAGTFTISDGVLENDDLLMLNPLLRVRGAGTSDLEARTVDYRITPKAVASLEGQGGDVEEKGVAVPVIIEGPWHDLSYRPDLKRVLKDAVKDPEAMKKDAQKAIKSLKKKGGGDLGETLKGLTGGIGGGDSGSGDGAGADDGSSDGAGDVKKQIDDAKDKIKGMFD